MIIVYMTLALSSIPTAGSAPPSPPLQVPAGSEQSSRPALAPQPAASDSRVCSEAGNGDRGVHR